MPKIGEYVTSVTDCIKDFDTSNIKGRTAIITGGASGIGAAYVRALSKAGAYVVIADLNEDGAKKLQQEFPDTSAAVRCNVTVWKDQLAAFKKALEISPENRIDIVVANAGISGSDGILANDATQDEPDEPKMPVLDVNINASFLTTKLALWYFERQNSGEQKHDASLVLQASMAGYLDLDAPQYVASKFAMRGLMRSLRRHVINNGIRVNLIAPWFIHTPMVRDSVVEAIKKSGAGTATVEDAAAALMKIVSDSTVVGRTLAIMPRSWTGAPNGYIDIAQDDFEDGTWMGEAQKDSYKPFNYVPFTSALQGKSI